MKFDLNYMKNYLRKDQFIYYYSKILLISQFAKLGARPLLFLPYMYLRIRLCETTNIVFAWHFSAIMFIFFKACIALWKQL